MLDLAFRDLRFPRLGRRRGGASAPPPVIVGNSNTITAFGETLTLSAAADYGFDQLGRAFIVTPPGGLTVLSRSRPATTAEGFPVNGTMRNPMRGAAQGWDGRIDNYSPELNVAYPVAVSPGDILVCQVHEPVALATTRSGVSQQYIPFYFVAIGWGANALAPEPISWPGRGTPQPTYIDLMAVAATLPAFDISGMGARPLADVQGKVQRTEIGYAMELSASATAGYQALTTRNASFSSNNYGEYLSEVDGLAGLYLISNGATQSQKATLLGWLIANGLTIHSSVVGNGDFIGPDGGHHQPLHLKLALALHFTGQTAALADLINTIPGNCLGQPFFYSSDQVAALAGHSDPTKAYIARSRLLTNVSGLTLTFQTDQPGGDLPKIMLNNMLVVRPSDGASAIVLTTPQDDVPPGVSTLTCTIDAQPVPPFAVSDSIIFRRRTPVVEGEVDYRIVTDDAAINPGPESSYRGQIVWTEAVLVPRALGIHHATWDALEQYVARANRASDPSTLDDYPTTHTSAFVETFYTSYAAQIMGDAPTFITRPSITGTAQVGATLTAVSASIGGDTPITSTWQWFRNGLAISGATASSYLVQAGDLGATISVQQQASNTLGARSLMSQSTSAVVNSYAVNAVEFDGTNDWLHASGLTPPAASKLGVFSMTFQVPATFPAFGPVAAAFRVGGAERGLVRLDRNTGGSPPTDRGVMSFSLRNAAGTNVISLTAANGTFLAGQYYTVVLAWDTATQTLVRKYRPAGGAWADLPHQGTPTVTLDALIAANDQFVLGASSSAGAGIYPNWYCAEVFYAPGQFVDLNNAAVLDRFLPAVSKGSNGSIPTGSQPFIYLSGATASWHTNKGTGGGLTEVGDITTAPVLPT